MSLFSSNAGRSGESRISPASFVQFLPKALLVWTISAVGKRPYFGRFRRRQERGKTKVTRWTMPLIWDSSQSSQAYLSIRLSVFPCCFEISVTENPAVDVSSNGTVRWVFEIPGCRRGECFCGRIDRFNSAGNSRTAADFGRWDESDLRVQAIVALGWSRSRGRVCCPCQTVAVVDGASDAADSGGEFFEGDAGLLLRLQQTNSL